MLRPKDSAAFFMRGNAYLAKGQPDAGITDYTASIAIDPKDADVHANLGNAYRAKGMNDQALGEFIRHGSRSTPTALTLMRGVPSSISRQTKSTWRWRISTQRSS